MALRLDRKLASTLSSRAETHRGVSTGVPQFILTAEDDRRPLGWGAAIAIVLHAVLLIVSLPQIRQEIRATPKVPKAYVIQAVRFKPPAPTQAQAAPQRKVRKVPIPDPTPDLPEPILDERYLPPDIEIPTLGEGVLLSEIPEAPPGPGAAGDGQALHLRADIEPPVKVFGPQPGYTEEARQARIQGVVILQAIIDVLGNVTNVRVLKGLPEGLAESAVATVQTWRFEPAIHDGQPVPVYYNFTVNFSLQ
jgi:protein TonB